MTEMQELPIARLDGSGYFLGTERVDGFADRRELSEAARTIIAALAEEYAPGELTAAQKELLGKRKPSELQLALARDEQRLDDAFAQGLYEDLGEEDFNLIRNPWQHPALSGHRYPLTIGEVAALTGATQRQLRHWEREGLIHAYRINSRRVYLASAVVTAMTLARAPQFTVTTLLAAVKRGGPGKLVRTLGIGFAGSMGARERREAGEALVRIGSFLRGDGGAAPSQLAGAAAGGGALRLGGGGRSVRRTTGKRRTATRASSGRATSSRTVGKRATAKRTPAKRKTAKRTAAKRTTAKRTAAKRTTAKRTTAKRTTAKRTTAKRTAAKRSGRRATAKR